MCSASVDPDDPVRALLRRLITDGLTSDFEISHLVPRDIENSWRRSISSKVDPAGQPRVEDLGSREDLIRSAAERVMNRWYASLSNTRTTLLLGNSEGQIVWRRTVDARDRRALDVVGAVEGSDFSESSSGTNGVGTSIEARTPILVRGSQHFLESLRDVACAAAPVIHPLTGRIIGSVSLTAASQEANDYMVAVARQASQEIADFLLEGADSRDVALVQAFRRARAGRRGVLVMNRDTVMSDLPAFSGLDGEAQAQIWDQLATHLAAGEERAFDLDGLGIAAYVTNVGRPADPVLELRLMAPTEKSGATSEPSGPVITSFQQAPVEVDEAVAAWWKSLTEFAEAHRKQEIVVPTPVGSDAEIWVHAWSIAIGRSARATVFPRSATDQTAGEDLEHRDRAATTGAVAPAFPSLRSRRSGLAGLARRAYVGPAPGPRFSAEALQCLLSWHWPGDFAELAELVARLPRSGTEEWTVGVADLPSHLSSSPHRPLSRWEQAERDSLLRALADSHGNKSDAAEMLGIGRTTLYRKLRTLSIDQRQIDELGKSLRF